MAANISVILPCRNEEHYISKVLDFFIRALPVDKELIIADGDSTDRTKEIIESYSATHPEIILIENPQRFVPFALNDCIRKASGKYIIRLDAHSVYADDYFLKVVETFEKTGAEIVGGPMRAKGDSAFQRAVSICTSTIFGVGDSKFHDDTAAGYTDSVYLGAWRKYIFEVTGLFDEEMLRNQDDEFHYRAKSKGMKIYLEPAIKSFYFPRNNMKKLLKQYFQYGLFKPLVLRKVKSEIKLRHLIPSAFVMYLFGIAISFPFIGYLSLIPLMLYFAIDLFFSFSKQQGVSEKMSSLLIYPSLHLSYGCGFILGLNNSVRKACFKG
ncbi:glycosyltransferase family 2 protein [soil metagenome]